MKYPVQFEMPIDGGTGVADSTTNELSDMELLGGDEESQNTGTEGTPHTEDGEGEESEVPLEGKETETLDEETETPEEITELSGRPSLKTLAEKFPDIFKTYPELRTALGREAAFSQIYPTLNDAKEAAEKSQILETFAEKLTEGDAGFLLKTLHDNDPKSVEKFSVSFLPSLFKGNPALFAKVTTPLIRNVLRQSLRQGIASGSKNLELSAKHLYNHIFGTAEIPENDNDLQEKDTPNPEVERLQQELEERNQTDFQNYRMTVGNEIKSSIRKSTELLLGEDFPLKGANREAVIKQIGEELGDTLFKDANHMKMMTGLFEKARKAGLSGEHKASIKTAYLARAKALLPKIVQKYKAETQGGNPIPTTRRSAAGAKGGNGAGKTPNAKDIDWRRTSDEQFLHGEITYKK